MATVAEPNCGSRPWTFSHWIALLILVSPHFVSAEQPEPAVRVSAIRYSPDGKHLAIGYGEREEPGGLRVLSAHDLTVLHKISADKGVSSIAYSPDGRWLAYSVFNQSPRVVRAKDFRFHVRLPDDRRGPISFSPDSKLLAMPHIDHSVRLYDVENQADTVSLKHATNRVLLVAFSNYGKRLLSGGYGGGTLWDVENLKPLHHFKHGESILVGGVFAPDDSQVLTTGWDATLRIWSTTDGKQVGLIRGGADRVAYSAKAGLLAFGGHSIDVKVFGDPFARLADARAKQLEEALAAWNSEDYETREQASRAVLELGWGAAARLQELVGTVESPEVRVRARDVLERLGEQERFSLLGHWGSISSIAFSPDGREIATGSEDGTVRIWDTKVGEQTRLLHIPRVAAAAAE